MCISRALPGGWADVLGITFYHLLSSPLDGAGSVMSSPIPEEVIQSLVVPNGGALLLSVVFSAVFYGITALQAYIYYGHYWDDRRILKIFVTALVIMDTLQLAFILYSSWWSLVINYGNLSANELVPPGIAEDVAITISMGLMVQCFFGLRVYRTSEGNIFIPVIIVILALAQFTLGIFYAFEISKSHLEITLAKVSWSPIAGIGCSMANDFVISASLCYYLRKIRSGMLKTDRLINVIVMYTVNTGVLTSMVSTCAIILTTVFPKTLWLSVPFCLISKCYVNSVLATLNAREKLRHMNSGLTLNPSLLERSDLQSPRSSTIIVRGHPFDRTPGTKSSMDDMSADV